MEFPVTIEYKYIKQVNPEYNSDKLSRYDALYYGGDRFHAQIDKFLDKREAEKGTPAFAKTYDERRRKARYANRVGGLVDWFTAATFSAEPEIETEDPELDALNDDCDGIGTDLPIVMRDTLLSGLRYGRSYLLATMDVDLDRYVISAPSALVVDDWEHDHKGRLLWARLRTVERIRDGIDAEYKRRILWTYYTPEVVATYELIHDEKNMPKDSDTATLISRDSHDFGVCPVFEVALRPGQWVVDRISDTAVALFNREANLGWLLDVCAFPQPIIKTEQSLDNLVTGESIALRLEQGGSYEYVTPATAAFSPSFDDIKRLEQNLYTGIQAMALEAASIPQAGRLSGNAVEAMRDPMHVLLASFAWPIREALESALKAVLEYRRKPTDIFVLLGFNRFEASMDDAKELITGEVEDGEEDGIGTGSEDGNQTGGESFPG